MFKKPKNPWLFAAGIAVGCMILDDIPQPYYGTFRDPGAAAMLSIILANATITAVRNGRTIFAAVAFLPLFFLKFLIQPLFWIHDADIVDTLVFGAALALLGFWAVRGVPLPARFKCAVVAPSFAIGAGFFIAVIGGVVGENSWLVRYFEIFAARILTPWAFWLAVLLVEREDQKERATPSGT